MIAGALIDLKGRQGLCFFQAPQLFDLQLADSVFLFFFFQRPLQVNQVQLGLFDFGIHLSLFLPLHLSLLLVLHLHFGQFKVKLVLIFVDWFDFGCGHGPRHCGQLLLVDLAFFLDFGDFRDLGLF